MEHCTHLYEVTEIMIDEYPLFGVLYCVFTLISSLSATLGNSIIIYVVWNALSMTPASRVFLLSLAASDFCVGLIVQPMYTVSTARHLVRFFTSDDHNHDHNHDHLECTFVKVLLFFVLLFAGASLYTIAAIAVDRYLALSLHLRYQELVTPTRANIVVAAIWIWSFLIAMMETFLSFNDIINSSLIIIIIVITTFAYIKIYKIARHHQNQVYDQAQLESQAHQIAQLARATKLAINALYVYVVMLICYVPSICIFPIFMMSQNPSPSLTLCYVSSGAIILYNSCLNPLVYCWKIREVRERVVDLLKRMFSRWNA